MNWYPRYPGDYARDTADLTLAEHGAYSLLLDNYYSTKGDIPKEITAVIRICRAFEDYEKQAVKVVLDRFFPVDEYGNRTNKRADKEQDKSKGIKEVRSAAGAVGAAKKWGEYSSKEKRSTRLAKAREKARHTKEEWGAMVSIHSHKCCKCGSFGDRGGIVKDHILPIYQGGSDGIDNLQPLCTSCNSSKGSDNQDYRQNGWQNALQNALQTPTIPQPQPQPQSTGHKSQPKPNKKQLALPCFESDAFSSAWNDWQEHRREIKKPLTPKASESQMSEFKAWGESRAIAAIRHTIKMGWQGIREPDTEAPPKKSQYGYEVKSWTSGLGTGGL